VSYVAIGLFGGAVAALFAAFPKELVMAVAGLALLGTIGNGLAAAVRDESEAESLSTARADVAVPVLAVPLVQVRSSPQPRPARDEIFSASQTAKPRKSRCW
jgi:predicted benzoate:H+ symporter BenE